MKFGQYELLERIAMGGMAEVYKGRVVGVEGFEKLVAIKRILPDLSADERFVTMLLTEARIHSALSHRNIVQIHDLGISEEGEYFIVLEYVEGYDLRAIMESIAAQGEIIPEALSLHIAAEVAQALHFAHELRGADGQALGLIHRDVSPSNVLISFAGEVKLSDFGLAKRRHDRSVVGSLKGNLIYMSPEQARQVSLDRRTDVFSLGAVLFELLTGQRLREITDEMKGWGEVAAGVVRSARSVRQDLPESLEQLLDRALAADPGRRFPDAGAFGAAIRQILAQMNTPVGPGDLQALLGLVEPPRKLRSELERSKVIRLAPEVKLPKQVVLPTPLPRLRPASQMTGMITPTKATPPPAKPAPRAGAGLPIPPLAKPPVADEDMPPTPPPVAAASPRTAPARAALAVAPPRAAPARGPAALAPPRAVPARAAAALAPPRAVPARVPMAVTPPAGAALPARPPRTARPRQPTPSAVTPPGPIAVSRTRPRPNPRANPSPAPTPPLEPPVLDWSARTTPPAPMPVPTWEAPPAQNRETPPPAQNRETPPPAQNWETPPPAQNWEAPPSAQNWEAPPLAQNWNAQPAPVMARDFPPLRAPRETARVQVLSRGLWRPVAVAVAALLVLAASAVHVAFVPLEVLFRWQTPAPLYVASEPEGGAVTLDGRPLPDATPTSAQVKRDRFDHVLEVAYPGYRPVRETVRYDRQVTLSFVFTLLKEGGPAIAPVPAVPAAALPRAGDAGGAPGQGRP